jgi:uncharacterized protein YqgC (DUF456 family)
MDHTIAVVLLGLCFLVGLALVALGLPGLWLMVVAVVAYAWVTGFHAVGIATIAVVLGLALLGELFEVWFGYGLARRSGGSRRAGWGALIGGLIGAAVGVPVPVVGSVIGALVGSFIGAVVFEYSSSWAAGTAVRAGWGALLGRVAATAAKMAVGFAIVVIAIVAALRR